MSFVYSVVLRREGGGGFFCLQENGVLQFIIIYFKVGDSVNQFVVGCWTVNLVMCLKFFNSYYFFMLIFKKIFVF